jgi:hypothetical protein
MEKRRSKFRYIFLIIVVYLVIGFIYGMTLEFRLTKKYGRSPFTVLINPWAYIRSASGSPFWPVDLYFSLYHFGNPFGHPLCDAPKTKEQLR